MKVFMFTYFIFGKMSFNTKVGMITGSNIAVAPSFQVHYQNLLLKGAYNPRGSNSVTINLKLIYKLANTRAPHYPNRYN